VLDILALRPGLEEANNVLITSLEGLGRFEEAATRMRGVRCWGIQLDGDALLAAWRSGGPAGYWRERLAQMLRMDSTRQTFGYALAAAHVELGEYEAAMDYLDGMVDAHIGSCVFLGVDPVLASMRGMPRFDAIVRRIGVPLPQTV
jgi:hypothetical protein